MPNPFPKATGDYPFFYIVDGGPQIKYAYSYDCLIHRNDYPLFLTRTGKALPSDKWLANWFQESEPQTEAIEDDDTGKRDRRKAKVPRRAGDQDKARTKHCLEFIKRIDYCDKNLIWLDAELRNDNPGLWGKNKSTFDTWFKTDEAKEAKKLLNNLKLEARRTEK
jgi:hypothetical protein